MNAHASTAPDLTSAELARLAAIAHRAVVDAVTRRHHWDPSTADEPAALRRDGAVFDATVGNAWIEDAALEDLAVPTLVIHAQDDPLASYDAARSAADRIPDARLVTLPSGGHLQLGQAATVSAELAAFLAPTAVPAPSPVTVTV